MSDTSTDTTTDTDENPGDDDTTENADENSEQDTFPRSYVEQLRSEAAANRVAAKRADTLAGRLLAATVREATAGVLADPTDLPADGDYFDDDGYPDAAKVTEAARALVERKPHLGDRRPTGTVDQGARPEAGDVNLAGILRGLAG